MFAIPQCSGANDTLTLPLLQTLLGIFTKMWSQSSLASAKPHLTIIPLTLDFRISPLLFFSLQILLPLLPSLLKQFFFQKNFSFLLNIILLCYPFLSDSTTLFRIDSLFYSPTLSSILLNHLSTLQPSSLLSNHLLYSPTLSSTLQPSLSTLQPYLVFSNPLLYSSTLSSILQPYPAFEVSWWAMYLSILVFHCWTTSTSDWIETKWSKFNSLLH